LGGLFLINKFLILLHPDPWQPAASGPARNLGPLSLAKLLSGLGVKLQLVRDPETAPLVERAPRRVDAQVRERRGIYHGLLRSEESDPLQPAA
jgi:hypothetical protein